MQQLQFYSQHGQDRYIYETFFKDQTTGFFIDIGAYDGSTYSNTRFLEETLGWKGICIEPIKTQFDLLAKRRKSKCINVCVSNFDGEAEFCEARIPGFGGMYSGLTESYDERHSKYIEQHSNSKITYKVPVKRLSTILKEFPVDVIDYCSIDTEGSELQIMEDIKENNIIINVLSIENNYRDENLHRYIEGCGFVLGGTFSGFDDLYLRAECIDALLGKT